MQIKHSPPSMYVIRLFMALVLVTGTLRAADTVPPENVRQISLQEAIRLALEHNLQLQIERLNPIYDQFNLRSSYSPWDPVFSASGNQRYQRVEGRENPEFEGVNLREGEQWNEQFRLGIAGTTPIGTEYNIGGTLSRSSGIFSQNVRLPDGTFVFIPNVNDPFQYTTFAGIDITQPLLRDSWIDSTRLNIKLGRTQLQISESELRQRLLDVIFGVEQSYYNLIFARENVRVQEAALELGERLLAENRKRVEVGAMAPLDEQQARSQAALRRSQLIEAQRLSEVQQNTLFLYLTQEFGEWQRVILLPAEKLIAVPQTFDVQESWRRAFELRPDLVRQRLVLEQNDIRLKYSHNQLFPALDLTASAGLTGVDAHSGPALQDLSKLNNPTYSFGVVFSMPVGNVGARNRHQANKVVKQQALLGLKQSEQNAMVEVDNAVRLARSSYERVQATRESRAFAEAALDAEQKKLENGKSTSFFVLQFQNDLTAARYEEIRALAEYNNALAQLAYREGTTLERHNIQIERK